MANGHEEGCAEQVADVLVLLCRKHMEEAWSERVDFLVCALVACGAKSQTAVDPAGERIGGCWIEHMLKV